jgi:hypothetical protein
MTRVRGTIGDISINIVSALAHEGRAPDLKMLE